MVKEANPKGYLSIEPSTVSLLRRAVEGTRISDSFATGTFRLFTFGFAFVHRKVLRTFRVNVIFTRIKKYTVLKVRCIFYPSDVLLSQAAARQVSSALQSLTTVFGMDTGVSSASLSLSS